jgi:hypothetical protein
MTGLPLSPARRAADRCRFPTWSLTPASFLRRFLEQNRAHLHALGWPIAPG